MEVNTKKETGHSEPSIIESKGSVVPSHTQSAETDSDQKPTSRNYSFLHKTSLDLDSVEDDNGNEYIIPAQRGSIYWAILKVMYTNADTPMRTDTIIDEVASLLKERDEERWEKFVNKQAVKRSKNGEVITRQPMPWRKRMLTNIQTLTRSTGSHAYGLRLTERGHILRWEPHHFDGKGAFVLRTDTNQPLKSKKG